MRGGAQPKHRAAAVEVSGEVFHPPIVRPQKSEEQKHHVRILQRLDAGHVRGTSLNVALFIESEEHRAFEAVTLG